MDCLAEGRSVSLPGMSVAATKYVLGTVGSYARVRKQFKVSYLDLLDNVPQKLLNHTLWFIHQYPKFLVTFMLITLILITFHLATGLYKAHLSQCLT